MPRIVKLLAVLLIICAVWICVRNPAPSRTDGGVAGGSVRLDHPLEAAVHSTVLGAFPGATLVERHAAPVNGTTIHFLYYRPLPDGPDRVLSHLQSSGAEVLRVIGGWNWYVSASVVLDGNIVVVDFYPDRENNRLVVAVR
ncbi:MAG TPA: hypothetical protein EYH14_00625 [Euryarchaeota archaeon]|nr:hypothetical protein [Euryarchaeota archaeon]